MASPEPLIDANTGSSPNPYDLCRDDSFAAVFIVKADTDLTLMAGNEPFFQILGYGREEIRYKYGNSLDALLEPDSLRNLATLLRNWGQQECAGLTLHFQRAGVDTWLRTTLRPVKNTQDRLFYGVGTDVSDYEHEKKALRHAELVLRQAATQVGMDYFIYDHSTGVARAYGTSHLLPRTIFDEQGCCRDFLSVLNKSGIVHPEYEVSLREAFAKARKGPEQVSRELRLAWEGRSRWVRLCLTLARHDGETGTFVVGTLEYITQQKESTRNYLNETQFFQALLSEQDAYGQLDVTEDRITRVGGIWNLYNEILDKVSYTQLITEFIEKVVHVEDRKHYLEIMQCSNFIQSLNNGIDRLGCQFRRIVDQNKLCLMQLNVNLFRDPFTQHVMALLCIKNINEQSALLPNNPHQPLPGHKPGLSAGSIVAAEDVLPSFDQFVGDQGDIAYLIDPATFNLICGNQAFYDRIGMSEAQCMGMKCYEAMHRRDTPCPFCSKANWSSDKFYLWRNLNLVLEQEFLIKNKLVNWRGQEAVLTLAIDISNDKSIVDSLENGATEVHSILGGVQRMTEAESLAEAMQCALEAIGSFFRAERVRLWQPGGENSYICTYSWQRRDKNKSQTGGQAEVSAWISAQKWEQPIMVESPEAMLCYSYDMYHYMKNWNIRNQRWVAVREGEEMLGCIAIDSMGSNLQNVAFLESFSVFIGSELKKRSLMEEALYADRHDDLTDLLSRKSFEEYLAAYHPDQIASMGVLIANFNNLKGINSSCGFQTGNYFLRQFADMLRQAFPNQAKYRLNGDEFLVMAPELTHTALDGKILELERLIKENGGFSVSLGAAWDDVENDLAMLIDQASQTMRVNKKRHYDSAAISIGAERRRMLSDLMSALEKGEYEVFLQPKVELLHGSVIGAEALIRYRDKELGIVPPAQFIGMMEKNNLIRYIDLFTFEEVCKQLEKWKQLGLYVPVVSINFSRLTLLERDILSSMEAIVSRYDVSKKSIEIEITESIVSMGKSVLHQAAADLYKAGYAISLDDFGTKYTNLSILAEMDFSMLKVDKSLVDKLGCRANDKLIMKNIIFMCKDLGIRVLAEGIESKDQEHILKEMECNMGQGYLYGKPMPIEDFTKKYIELGQRR